jgi:uncharacterized lipoprotein YmbA
LRPFLLGAWLFILGCAGSAPANFYTLSPLSTTNEAASRNETAGRELAIGIGPIRVPQYLMGKGIVTRTGPNQIKIEECDLWGGSLEDDFSLALLENLSLLLAGERVSLPWLPRMGPMDYRVGVDVIRFDGRLGGNVFLHADWSIRMGREKKIVGAHNSRIEEPTGAQTYEAMAGGMSRALGNLSREIAQAIRALPR